MPRPPDPNEIKIILKPNNISKLINTFTRNRRYVDMKAADNQVMENKQSPSVYSKETFLSRTEDIQKRITGSNDFHEFIKKIKEIKAKETAAPFNNFMNQFKAMKDNEKVEKTQKANYNKFIDNLKELKHEERREKEENMVTRKDKQSDEHVLADVRYNLQRAFDIKERREDKKSGSPDITLRNLKKRSLNGDVVIRKPSKETYSNQQNRNVPKSKEGNFNRQVFSKDMRVKNADKIVQMSENRKTEYKKIAEDMKQSKNQYKIPEFIENNLFVHVPSGRSQKNARIKRDNTEHPSQRMVTFKIIDTFKNQKKGNAGQN